MFFVLQKALLHITAFFLKAEKPSEDTARCLFLMNMKGLTVCVCPYQPIRLWLQGCQTWKFKRDLHLKKSKDPN
jgi:hypothetical protein